MILFFLKKLTYFILTRRFCVFSSVCSFKNLKLLLEKRSSFHSSFNSYKLRNLMIYYISSKRVYVFSQKESNFSSNVFDIRASCRYVFRVLISSHHKFHLHQSIFPSYLSIGCQLHVFSCVLNLMPHCYLAIDHLVLQIYYPPCLLSIFMFVLLQSQLTNNCTKSLIS